MLIRKIFFHLIYHLNNAVRCLVTGAMPLHEGSKD